MWNLISSQTFASLAAAGATIAIAIATVVNVYLFNRSQKVSIAMQYLLSQSDRMARLRDDLTIIERRIEKGEDKDKLREQLDNLSDHFDLEMRVFNRMVKKLGGKRLYREMTTVLNEVIASKSN